MAKSKNKDKAPKKALSYGNLYSQEAVTQFLINFGRQPDTDEVLRKQRFGHVYLTAMVMRLQTSLLVLKLHLLIPIWH